MKEKLRDNKNAIIGVAIALFVGLGLLLWILETELQGDRAQLVAQTSSAHGVAPDSTFLLTVSPAPGNIGQLKKKLSFDPAITYDVEELKKGEYIITPMQTLKAGSTLAARYGSQRFSFTVQNVLVVTSTFPYDGAHNVPATSGIEFSFNSDDITSAQLKEAFSISPATEGTFDVQKERFIFYPAQPFESGATYQVTVQGLQSQTGAALAEPFTLHFTVAHQESDAQKYFQLYGNGISTNALPDEKPLMRAYVDDSLGFNAATPVQAEVFAFDNWQSYAAELTKCVGGSPTMAVQVDTDSLKPVSTQPMKVIEGEFDYFYYQGSWALEYPETLPEGYYLINLSFSSGGMQYNRQHFLQVSHYSFFYLLSDDNLVAWLNDSSTGQPVSGAAITMDGDFEASATTGADGSAQVLGASVSKRNQPSRFGALITVQAGSDVFVDVNNYYNYGAYYYSTDNINAQSRQYISYLYTDRPYYRTTDTIQLWGVARSRNTALTAPPSAVTLKLSTYGSDFLTQVDAEVKPDGTFTASLPLDNLDSNWYTVQLWVGNTMVDTQYLMVEDFVKPVNIVQAATDRPVYLMEDGDEIQLGVDVSMYDGTPISQFELDFQLDEHLHEIHADRRTGEDGHATATLRIFGDSNNWYPTSLYYNISSPQPQAEPVWQHGQVYGIYRNTMLRGDMVKGTNGQSAEITTHAIDISGITHSDQLFDYQNYQGAPLDIPVKAQLYHVYYEKTVNGTYYDYTERKTKESYTYNRQEELVDTFQFQTQNGRYQLDNLPQPDMDNSYYLKLSARDGQGKPVESTVYLGTLYERWGYESSAKTFELRKNTTADDHESYENDGVTQYYWMGGRFSDGENAEFTLYGGDEPVPQGQGRLLYTVVQDIFSRTTVQDSGSVTIPFAEDLVPNYVLTGAYFDGRYTYPLTQTTMHFNPENRRLQLDISTDADSYAPGDEVAVEVSAVHTASGQPAKAVSLVLGVVDEAIFTLQEQDIDILHALYQDIYFPQIQQYTSNNISPDAAAGEMGGGGGGDQVRKDFADTAQVLTATTDADGKARLTFTMPDNITSWRLSALGIDANGAAGSNKADAICTKPYFVTPIVSETLQQGDSLAVGLYGAGSRVSSTDMTQYTVEVSGDGIEKSESIQSPVRTYTSVDFGQLPLGLYTLRVTGQCQGQQDAVELPVEVVKSGLQVSVVKSFSLADGFDIAPQRWPVSIVFYGEGGKTYNQVLRNLVWNSDGQRADMRLARVFAAQRLQDQGQWYDSEALDDHLGSLNGSTVLQLFPYSSPDLEFSLKAHLAAPDLVSDKFLSAALSPDNYYLTNVPPGAVYLAQAMDGQAFDTDLFALANSSAMPQFTDKVYLAMALYQSGEEAKALELYQKWVLPQLNKSTAVGGETLLSAAGEDQQESQKNTAAASMLATMLKTDEAEGLVRQLTEKDSQYEPYLLEQMYYLTTFGPTASGSGIFTYQQNGETIDVTLDGTLRSLTFTQQQLEEAHFAVTSGKVYADVYYKGGPEQMDAASPGNRIGLIKTIEPVDSDSFQLGQLVKVTLTPDFSSLDTTAGNRLLVLEDYIPSGLRFESFPDNSYYPYDLSSMGWYLSKREGQQVQFTIYGLWGSTPIKPIVYYARVAAPGTYVVESAYITSSSSNAWGLSPRGAVTID